MKLGTTEIHLDVIARTKDGSIEQVIGHITLPVNLVANELDIAQPARYVPVDTEINLLNSGWLS